MALLGPFFLKIEPPMELLGFNPWIYRIIQFDEDLHRNTLAGLLSIGILLTISLLILSQERKTWTREKSVLSLFLVTMAIVLLMTSSRGAIASCLITVIILVSTCVRNWKKVFLPALGIVSVSVFVIISKTLLNAKAFETRMELWDHSLFAISSFPLTGIGAGVFSEVIPVVFPLFIFDSEGTPPHSHNMYLQAALDLGLPGMIAVMTLLFWTLMVGVAGYRMIRRNGNREKEVLLVGLLGCILSVLIHGVIDSTLWLNKPHPLIFLIAGLIPLIVGERMDYSGLKPRQNIYRAAFSLFILLGLTATCVILAGEMPIISLATALVGSFFLGLLLSVIPFKAPESSDPNPE
jgi:hypothetical protein